VPDTDNDTQYTAGNGLNLDGSNEFTAVASPDADNALDVRANGIYATDDQDAGEVSIADAGNNFTGTTVEAALAELAGSSTSMYVADGTLTGPRTVNGGSNSLTFTGINGLQFSSVTLQAFTTGAIQLGSTGGTTQISGVSGIQLQHATTVQSNLTVNGSIIDSSGDAGTSGQLLSSTASGTNWIDAPTIVSTDAENELVTGTDGGASFEMTDIDVDGDGAVETTVDQAMADITKITATAGRIFYPPSIAVDASTIGIKNIDLYQEYLDQFGTPTVSSAGAPAALPTYGRTDLYYYVTYADPSVFETDSGDPNFMTIDANGNLTIEVENLPTDYNALINVVFMVK
ncbi:hypothetical protein, partial [Flagellimonas onchidii]|uniref:hypothetical protein n=1 Tax=Flagellimonas onchidii TaxID=2562684 RepID=UPI0014562518